MVEDPVGGEDTAETVSSRHDRAAPFTCSWLLGLPAQEQNSPHSSLEEEGAHELPALTDSSGQRMAFGAAIVAFLECCGPWLNKL